MSLGTQVLCRVHRTEFDRRTGERSAGRIDCHVETAELTLTSFSLLSAISCLQERTLTKTLSEFLCCTGFQGVGQSFCRHPPCVCTRPGAACSVPEAALHLYMLHVSSQKKFPFPSARMKWQNRPSALLVSAPGGEDPDRKQ